MKLDHKIIYIFLLIFIVLKINTSFSQEKKLNVLLVEIKQNIDPRINRYTKLMLEEVEKKDYDIIIIEMDTYGGALNDADEGWRVKNEPMEFTKNGSVLAAREVTVPQENTQFLAPGGEINKGNYLPAFGAERRMNFLERNLAINFFDTEEDLEHIFFRPWMIAIATHGLIERDLLCTAVELRQYNNRGEMRKGYRFTDVFPTNVEGYSLNYNDDDFKQKTVTFAFKNYIQL